MAHKESLKEIMADPEMQQLSDTWMGAFYTKPPKMKKKQSPVVKYKTPRRMGRSRMPETIQEVTHDQTALTGSIDHEEQIL